MTQRYKNILALIMVLVGLGLRFNVQFLEPFFNNDEIDLGININQRGFIDLLYPLKHYQTAPPLFLWFFKCIYLFPLGATWLKYKVVIFILNLVFLKLFWDFIQRISNIPLVQLTALLMVCCNPFFIYHGLTLKQYLPDAIIAMLLARSFTIEKSKSWFKPFWVVAPLLSNPALFIYTGKLLGDVWHLFREKRKSNVSVILGIWESIKDQWRNKGNRWLWMPVLLYVVYFFWYRQQDGYIALTRFMWEFWKKTFFSNPHDFFIRIYYFFVGNVTFIFSHDKTLANLGTLALFFGLWTFYKKQKNITNKASLNIYFWSLGVFVVLNIFKLYPIAPRLLFYFSPVVVWMIAYLWEWRQKWVRALLMVLFLVGFTNYTQYYPFKENDVVQMTKVVEKANPKLVLYSMNTEKAVRKFEAFTEKEFHISDRLYTDLKSNKEGDTLFVIKLVHQFGRNGENGPIKEQLIKVAAASGRLALERPADGFNIYTVKDPNIIAEFLRDGIINPKWFQVSGFKSP